MIVTNLTTLANVKGYLSSTALPTTDDALLNRLIQVASSVIIRYVGRDVTVNAYNETRNGNGASQLALKQYPIISISSLTIDTTAVPQAASPTSYGFLFDEFMVYLNGYAFASIPTVGTQIGNSFTKGFQNINIQYSAGFNPVPYDIEQVCIDLVALWYTDRKRIGQTGVTMAGETISYLTSSLATRRTLTPLEQFRRRFIPT